MKMSLCQRIAIFCILAMGFLTVAPSLQQDVFAWGPSHSYQVALDTVLFRYCTSCGSWTTHDLGVRWHTFTHSDNEDHILGGTIYITGSADYCSNCSQAG